MEEVGLVIKKPLPNDSTKHSYHAAPGLKKFVEAFRSMITIFTSDELVGNAIVNESKAKDKGGQLKIEINLPDEIEEFEKHFKKHFKNNQAISSLIYNSDEEILIKIPKTVNKL